MNNYIRNNVTSNMSYGEVAKAIQLFYTNSFPSHYWIVITFENVQGSANYSWDCVLCFASLNVFNTYHVFVAGVQRSEPANTALLTNPVFANSINSYNDAGNLTSSWYNSQCISGAFAVRGDIVGKKAADDLNLSYTYFISDN